jgi:hypothetical protein
MEGKKEKNMMMIVKHRKRKVMERQERNEVKVVMKMMKCNPDIPSQHDSSQSAPSPKRNIVM